MSVKITGAGLLSVKRTPVTPSHLAKGQCMGFAFSTEKQSKHGLTISWVCENQTICVEIQVAEKKNLWASSKAEPCDGLATF